jgi:hypothetical protein
LAASGVIDLKAFCRLSGPGQFQEPEAVTQYSGWTIYAPTLRSIRAHAARATDDDWSSFLLKWLLPIDEEIEGRPAHGFTLAQLCFIVGNFAWSTLRQH